MTKSSQQSKSGELTSCSKLRPELQEESCSLVTVSILGGLQLTEDILNNFHENTYSIVNSDLTSYQSELYTHKHNDSNNAIAHSPVFLSNTIIKNLKYKY